MILIGFSMPWRFRVALNKEGSSRIGMRSCAFNRNPTCERGECTMPPSRHETLIRMPPHRDSVGHATSVFLAHATGYDGMPGLFRPGPSNRLTLIDLR